MRRLVPVLLVLVTGCSTGTAAPRALVPPAPAASGARATPGAQAEQVLAVVTASGGLQLYGIGRHGAVAHLVRTLQGPEGATASGVTLSGGTSPRVCAVWDTDRASTLRCYDGTDTRGTDVPTPGVDLRGPVGLSWDGQGLAWAGDEHPGQPGDAPTLFVQRAEGGQVARFPAYRSPQDAERAALGVGGICWSGDDTVLVSHSVDDDVNGEIAQVSLTTPPKGWTDAPLVTAPQAWPVLTGATSSTRDGMVLAALEGFAEDGTETWEAAQLDLGAKHVASVVAVAAAGRAVVGVSGGPGGVVYRTRGDTDTRTYWRAPGKAHGSPVVGLPAGVKDVVAQP